MKNELRAMADRANENRQIEHRNAVTAFVEKRIIPELKKRAACGYYGYTIETYGKFRSSEIVENLEKRGLSVQSVRDGFRVIW